MSGDDLIVFIQRVYEWLEQSEITSTRSLILAGLFAIIGLLALREAALWFLKIRSLQSEIRKLKAETQQTIRQNFDALKNELHHLREVVNDSSKTSAPQMNSSPHPLTADATQSASTTQAVPSNEQLPIDQTLQEPSFRLTH